MKRKYPLHKIIIFFLYSILIFRLTFLPCSFWPGFQNVYLFYGLGVLITVLTVRDFFASKYFIWVAAYISIMLLNYLFQPDLNLGNILSEGFTIYFTSAIAYFLFFKDGNETLCRWVLWEYIIILTIYSVQTYSFYQSNSTIVRASLMEYNYEKYLPFLMLGLTPYFFPHALSCVLPAFISGIRANNKIIKKTLFVILLLLSIALIYMTQATGAMSVAIFSIIIGILLSKTNYKHNLQKIIIIGLLFMPFALNQDLQYKLLNAASDFVGQENLYMEKIDELKSSVSGTAYSGDIDYRGRLLEKTLNTIASYPILGTDKRTYGNHNALLDRWAEYGLVGFIPIICLIFVFVRDIARKIPPDLKSFYLLGIISNLVMMLTKSMFGWDQWFAFLVVLPIMISFSSENKTKKLC